MIEGLIEGRMVHYVPGPNDGFKRDDHHVPAVIVSVWNEATGAANMQCFIDNTNDMPGGHGTYWATSREYSEEPKPYTWHFIERK